MLVQALCQACVPETCWCNRPIHFGSVPLGEQPWTTWYEPLADPESVRAAVSWVLAHDEVTGLATPGDVRLLRLVVRAERERLGLAEAEAALADVEDYSSPFAAMPAGL